MGERRVVLVTGGSRGIGRALVEAFAADGWAVAACSTEAEGAEASGADYCFACDVANTARVRSGIASTLDALGRIDALVNNAGIAGGNSFDPRDDDELWHRIIDVNLHGTYYVCKYGSPHLPDRTGRIINIASVLAHYGVADQTAYCASKHAVLGLTRALAMHLAPRGITVNAICPTWVNTDMAKQRFKELGITEADAAASIPIGRVVKPREVANLAVYLASDAAAAISGQDITIDGGGAEH